MSGITPERAAELVQYISNDDDTGIRDVALVHANINGSDNENMFIVVARRRSIEGVDDAIISLYNHDAETERVLLAVDTNIFKQLVQVAKLGSAL